MSDASHSPQRRLRWQPILIVALILIVFIVFWRCFMAPVTHTTVYVVRHAEKASTPPSDPPLTAAGTARAQALAHVLGLIELDAVYATQFQRTQLTVAPTAADQGLAVQPYNASDTGPLITSILSDHAGGAVLVAGHSNTVDDLLDALGVPGVAELSETTFDRLFVVHRLSQHVHHFEPLRYGAPTP
jgi:broad specificity phosphatase PhoE